jgi:hypothetical protein
MTTTKLQAFDAALAARAEIKPIDANHPLQKEYEVAIRAAWKARHPRARKLDHAHCWEHLRLEDPQGYQAIRASYNRKVEKLYEGRHQRIAALDAAIREAALAAPICPAPGVWSLYVTVSTSTYWTQSDPGSYVRSEVEARTQEAQALGLQVRKQTVGRETIAWRDWHGRPCSQESYTVEIWVNTDALTAEALKRRRP